MIRSVSGPSILGAFTDDPPPPPEENLSRPDQPVGRRRSRGIGLGTSMAALVGFIVLLQQGTPASATSQDTGLIHSDSTLQMEGSGLLADYWSAWLEARLAPTSIASYLDDSEGFQFACVDETQQPAFRRGKMYTARAEAAVAAHGISNGILYSTEEISLIAQQEMAARSPGPSDVDTVTAQQLLNNARSDSLLETTSWPHVSTEGENPTRLDVQSSIVDIGECPEGTVPIRQYTVDDIASAGSLESFLTFAEPMGTPPVPFDAHKHVVASHSNYTSSFQGARAIFNIWNPDLEHNDEFSLAQLWLASYPASGAETVEAGIQKFPARTKSQWPRIFVYVTSDGYDVEKGYDSKNGYWVQTHRSIKPGDRFANHSSIGGTQYRSTFRSYRGQSTGNWFIMVNGMNMGYYPASLFENPGLLNGANAADFGGEILDRPDDSTTTATDMGSGRFAMHGFGQSAYMRNIKIKTHSSTGSLMYADPTLSAPDATVPDCYDGTTATGSYWEYHLFYGGPGVDAVGCP